MRVSVVATGIERAAEEAPKPTAAMAPSSPIVARTETPQAAAAPIASAPVEAPAPAETPAPAAKPAAAVTEAPVVRHSEPAPVVDEAHVQPAPLPVAAKPAEPKASKPAPRREMTPDDVVRRGENPVGDVHDRIRRMLTEDGAMPLRSEQPSLPQKQTRRPSAPRSTRSRKLSPPRVKSRCPRAANRPVTPSRTTARKIWKSRPFCVAAVARTNRFGNPFSRPWQRR